MRSSGWGDSSGVKVPVGGKLWLGMMFLVRSSGWGKALVEGDASDAKLRLGESPDWG